MCQGEGQASNGSLVVQASGVPLFQTASVPQRDRDSRGGVGQDWGQDLRWFSPTVTVYVEYNRNGLQTQYLVLFFWITKGSVN